MPCPVSPSKTPRSRSRRRSSRTTSRSRPSVARRAVSSARRYGELTTTVGRARSPRQSRSTVTAVSYLSRQLLTAALTANAVQPVPSYYVGVPAMLGGWLTSELAPHLAALTAADTLRELTLGRRNRPGL